MKKELANEDIRWDDHTRKSIDLMVQKAFLEEPTIVLGSRKGLMGASERKEMLTLGFQEIVKATSVDTLTTAPPILLEQFCALSLAHDDDIKNILAGAMRSFITLLGHPVTHTYAKHMIEEMDCEIVMQLARDEKIEKVGSLSWKAMPNHTRNRT